MCTYQTETLKVSGSAKTASGWTKMTDATVYFDHPVHYGAGHALLIDVLNPGEGPSTPGLRSLQVVGADQHHARRVDGHHRHFDRPDRAAGHLHRDSHKSSSTKQHLLSVVDDSRLHDRYFGAGRELGPSRRHVGSREDVQPWLRRLYVLLLTAQCHLDVGYVGRHLARRHATLSGRRRRVLDRELDGDSHGRLPRTPTRHGHWHQSDRRYLGILHRTHLGWSP